MAVFLATGIWHGAAFNFVFWGIFHGIIVVLENILGLDKKKASLLILPAGAGG